jgi:hypothetical protein
MSQPLVTAAVEAPAAGSPVAQIAIATGFATLTTLLLLWLVLGHLQGRSTVLARAGQASTRWMGVEPWAALPMTVASIGLLAGGFGVFWDIALHIDVGRDEGPLANPSHYPILFCLYSLFAAGVLAIGLHHEKAWNRFARRAIAEGRDVGPFRAAPRALQLPGGYTAPIGGALLLLCGMFALSGFPLDDLWHRMFGQDVTLWGPTHLVMINGAILSPPILAILALESKHARGHVTLSQTARSVGEQITRAFIPGAVLFSIAFWATEFDWGVPQYRLVWQPLLLSLAAAFAFAFGRLWLGRGGALKTLAVYLVARGAMELATAGLGQTAPMMPIFAVEALLIEAIALRWAPERRPLPFGAVCGLVAGTAGFAFTYVWTGWFSPQPWSAAMVGEGLPVAVAAGVAGGLLGALLGSAMYGTLPAQRVRRRTAIGSALVVVALGVNALWLVDDTGVRTDVTITPTAAVDGVRAGYVTAKVTPASAAQDASWFTVLAWQTGEKRTHAQMVLQADGTWRSDKPVPLGGKGKTLLRLHKGRSMIGVALHLPRDPAIPSPGVTRPDAFSAALVDDHRLMQTERRDYVPAWLWTPAAIVMLLCCAAFLTAMSIGIARATEVRTGRTGDGPQGGDGVRGDDADAPARRPAGPRRLVTAMIARS